MNEPIAIIGIGCRFPGEADSPAAFWKLISTRGDAIRDVPADRWDAKQFYDPDPSKPGKITTRWGGFIENVDRFDAQFFGISPREAARMDPQQRVLLEVAYEALEDAGQPGPQIAGSNSAVFVGISSFDYSTIQTDHRDRNGVEGYNSTGNALSIAANRISYIFDLRGPSTAVDTACSSALTAVHLACQSIWHQGCPLALAGGVSILISVDSYLGFSRLGMLSPDGRCKAFDARANGYVRSEGAGMVVLKPLAQALADGDRIYAVIRGTAINQDGRSSGLTVPNQQSQEALLREACHEAGLDPAQIQYVEAHGTGTPVGDPIEARALGSVLSTGRPAGDYCRIGSVKTNIGHLEAASGIAGLIKTALALHHREIPASLHYEHPNPEIPFEELRLRVARDAEPWPAEPGRAAAGINSFGFGGANAHAVLSEAPPRDKRAQRASSGPWVIPLSARSQDALRALAGSYAQAASDDSNFSFANICYNAARRRTHYDHRLGVVCRTREEMIQSMKAYAAGGESASVVTDRVHAGESPKLLWAFSGQGPQWWAMGRQLLEGEPVFRNTVRQCDQLMSQWSDWSLWKELTADESASRMLDTAIAQPAIFAVQAGLAELWKSWGIRPGAIVGHSVGEVAAAYVAGVLTLEDAVRVIFQRGRCMQFAKGNGKMLAVGLSLNEALKRIATHGARVGVAAINGPTSITLSGEPEPLHEIAQNLERDEVFNRFLSVPYAFHSSQMDAAEKPLLEALRDIRPRPAEIPLFSTVTGNLADGLEWGADYWWQNVRYEVRFAEAVGRAAEAGYHVALEIGPHPVLSGSLLECFQHQSIKGKVVSSLRRNEEERRRMLLSLAALYTIGCPIDWEAVAPSAEVVALPSYPWQRERHWHESEDSLRGRLRPEGHPLLGSALNAPLPTWRSVVGTGLLDYLKDHCLQDHPLVPATAYLEMALSAAKNVFPEGPYALEEVRFDKACFLDDGQTLEVQTTFEPANSSFQIYSRSTGNGNAWTPHASGILRSRQFGLSAKFDPDAVKVRCQHEIGPAACYAALKEMGLVYGETFQGIERLWCGKGEALGQIRVPDVIVQQGKDYSFHPALLDACIQVLFGTIAALVDVGSQRREVYLPVEIAEVRVHGAPGDRVWSYARLVERNRQGIVTDVLVYNASGELVWEARGLGCKQLRLEGTSRQRAEELVYEDRWMFQPSRVQTMRSAAFLRSPMEVVPEVRTTAANLRNEQQVVERHRRFEAMADSLCAAFVWQAFQKMAGAKPLPQHFTAESLAEELGVAPQHRLLLDRFLRWLENDGVLRRSNLDFELVRDPDNAKPEEVWSQAFTQHPRYFPELMLLGRVGRQLAGVLRGDTNPLQVIFPDGTLNTSEHLYQDAAYCRYFDFVAKHAIDRMIADFPPGRTLRVLEIGAGTGSLAFHVLPSLPANRTEYVFTDVANVFLVHGQQKFQEYPFVRYRTLDIESDPVQQGFAPHSFDLVLSSSVLHATADLKQTLTNVKTLLSSDGAFVMIDSVRPMRWVDTVFGLTEGWWRFTDKELRPDHPTLAAPKWETLLNEVGFVDVHDVTDSVEADLAVAVVIARGPRLQVADGDAIVSEMPIDRAARWVVLADRQGSAERLAHLMRSRGQDCKLVFREHTSSNGNGAHGAELRTSAEMLELLQQVSGADKSTPLCLVYMWGLDAPTADELEPATLEAVQGLAAMNLVSLVQACSEATDSDIRLYVVTRDAFSVDGSSDLIDLTQSPLIGLTRVIMSEYPKLRSTIVDLGYVDIDAELRAFADELCSPLEEDEVALRGENRYVQRYVPFPLRKQITSTANEGEPFCLDTDGSNTLDGLTLRSTERRAPGPDEVEIRVVAAGLNFSDVLKGLGLYPGLPDGPVPFGIECSGKVVAVGERVKELRVGDAVLLIAPFTFSAYITVPAGLVVRMPKHIDFEEGATIPIAFLTAYHALHYLGHLQAGEKVLIHSASGGVGLAAIQLARAAGAEILVTAGTPEKRQLLEALGIKHVMDSRSLTFADEVMERTQGKGVDIILNSLPGEAISKGLSVLADYGRFLEIGKRDIYQNSRLGMAPFRKNLSFIAIDLDRAMRRTPALVARQLREVVDMFEAGKLFPLSYRTFPITNIRGAFRYMAHGKHLGKIVVSLEARHRPVIVRDLEERQCVSADATYLVTGGLTGFGLAAAQWLLQQGARHLVLASRRGLDTPGAEAEVAVMQQSGAEIVVHQTDVSDSAQVAGMIQRIEQTMPPLRGVVHAAMVLDDCQLLNLTPERWHRVQAPKATGAWNLHLQTQHLPLDFFVCFSSMSSVFGFAGQSNYAAANAVLDGLADYRRAKRLATLTVNWGYLGEVGYVARNEKIGQRFDAFGLHSISRAEAFSLLAQLIRQRVHRAGAMRVDWPNFRIPGISDKLSPRFADLAARAEAASIGQETDSVSARQLVLAAAGDERKELLESLLRKKVARVLGASPSDLDSQKPLNELGLDSIMGVELRNWIADDLRIDLPAVELVRGPSMDHLVNLLLAKLSKESDTAASTSVESNLPPQPEPDAATAQVAALSNEEVDQMLKAMSADRSK